MWPVCHSCCEPQMTRNSTEDCAHFWGKNPKLLSDFVQLGVKILPQGGFSHSPWETVLAATASAACGSYSIAPSQFKPSCRRPWDGNLLHSFTAPVVNPVEPRRTAVWQACKGRESQAITHCIAGQWCHHTFSLLWFSAWVLGLGFLGEGGGGVHAVGFFHATKGGDRSHSLYYRKAAISGTYCQKVNCLWLLTSYLLASFRRRVSFRRRLCL